MVCCWRGNSDAAYIDDPTGAGCYCASYISKSEAPDTDVMVNVVARNLSKIPPEARQHIDIFRAVLNGLASATVVGATQAAWVMMRLPFVIKSREIISINTLPQNKITVNLRNLRQIKEDLAEFGNTADTVDKSPGSNLGRRLAYTAFVQQQNALAEAAGYDECQVSFHSVMSQFRLAWSPKPTAACTPEAGGKCAEGPPTKKSKAGDATGGAEASEDHGDGNGAGDDDCENEGEEVDEETESTSGVGFLHFPPTLRVY